MDAILSRDPLCTCGTRMRRRPPGHENAGGYYCPLHAAAPDLLEALRRLLSTIPQGRDDCDCSSCADERFARAALARAEGRAEL